MENNKPEKKQLTEEQLDQVVGGFNTNGRPVHIPNTCLTPTTDPVSQIKINPGDMQRPLTPTTGPFSLINPGDIQRPGSIYYA